jgi:hypothetical protein
MSQTDTRPGFRLPWTGERADAEASTDGSEGTAAETGSNDAEASVATDGESPAQSSDGSTGMAETTVTEEPGTNDMTEATATATGRRPTKFMADLSKAMQTAAEASRDETMTRFTADAKVAVEDIRAKSAEEAAALRRQADDDVAAVREWSKSEIARIREETDTRIAARKQALDGEMDAFAQVIEARVQRVNAAVSEYEIEMAEFFERLLGEQDPTRIATMAQAMPDPPELAAIAASITEAAPAVEPASEPETETAYGEAEPGTPSETGETVEATAETFADEAPADVEGAATADAPTDETAPVAEGEAAQADESEMVGATEGDTNQDTQAGENAEAAAEPAETATSETGDQTDQSELAAPDYAAAEAEAAAMSNGLDADDGLSMLAAARLDAFNEAPGVESAERSSGTDRITTRVVVRGLVSVASIATFKRTLGRVQGVAAIGVASGPDGEFVFTVSHDSSLNLVEAITGLPGFEAQIASETPGNIEVSAHDPDTGD